LRAVGALVGALVWSQMFLSLIVVPPDELRRLMRRSILSLSGSSWFRSTARWR
jgi:hypothetical protein